MSNEGFGQHISRQYNEELEDIRHRVMVMGGLVEQQLTNAIKALVDGDAELGETVVSSDYRVNAMEVNIDEECVQVLARRQPAAGDLRLIMAVIKTITDLERIGDEAERVGRMASQVHNGSSSLKISFASLEYMGQKVRDMVHDALDAFARMDVEAAVKVWHEDAKVNKEYEGILRQLMTFMMEDPRSIPRILDIIWAVRSLERVGDRATNICEYVIYLVNGRDVRHITQDQMNYSKLSEQE